MLQNQKIAITGASGFLGRNLLHHLGKNNYQLTVLDRGKADFSKAIRIVKGNLLTGEGIDEFLSGSGVLIHLAGQVSPDSTSMGEGNIRTTENLVSKVRKHQVKRIIFSSTVAVYGSSSNEKLFKESDICNPDTEYGLSKFKAEEIIKKLCKEIGIQYTMLRFSSLYGPGNNKGLVYNLCTDLTNKGMITVYGDGRQKRDLVWGDDAARVLLVALEQNLKGVYNIGAGNNYSILDIISILEKVSGRKSRIVFKKPDTSKMSNIFYSIEKIKKETGWMPKMTIEEGLKLVYKSLLKYS